MKSCREYKETLWLDVYGELSPEDRPSWGEHLKKCEACRREREQLVNFLQHLREVSPSPTLSPVKAETLTASIKRKLRGRQEKRSWPTRLLGAPNRLVPALAAACILIVLFGWLGVKEFSAPESAQNASNLKLQEQVLANDLEIVRNLELLEEMETIQKLVKVVDGRKAIQYQ
jgi:anti-sigma factor RsiW